MPTEHNGGGLTMAKVLIFWAGVFCGMMIWQGVDYLNAQAKAMPPLMIVDPMCGCPKFDRQGHELRYSFVTSDLAKRDCRMHCQYDAKE